MGHSGLRAHALDYYVCYLSLIFQELLCWSYLSISHLKQLALACVVSGDTDKVRGFKKKLTCGQQDLQQLLGSFHGTDGQWKLFREKDRVRKIRYNVSESCMR